MSPKINVHVWVRPVGQYLEIGCKGKAEVYPSYNHRCLTSLETAAPCFSSYYSALLSHASCIAVSKSTIPIFR